MAMYTQVQLDEARAAYYRIITGQSVTVVIDQNGERIEFQKANVSALAELIRKMELDINASINASALSPLRVFF